MYRASPPSSRRLFIAISAPDVLQDHARRLRGKWLDAPLTWVAGRDLHITLVPPWESRNVTADMDRFNRMSLTSKTFPMQFEEVSFGPHPDNPRLIWAHGPTPEGLLSVKEEVEKMFAPYKDRRPFHLHLTIARFAPDALAALKNKKMDERVSWRDTATTVILMESIRSRDAMEYRTLAERKLAA